MLAVRSTVPSRNMQNQIEDTDKANRSASLDADREGEATGKVMSRLRVLVLGPDCNPDQVSIPLVTYYHAAALAQLHDVTLVARSAVEDTLRRSKAPFRAIEAIRTPMLDRIFDWCFRRIFKSNYDTQALTAFNIRSQLLSNGSPGDSFVAASLRASLMSFSGIIH